MSKKVKFILTFLLVFIILSHSYSFAVDFTSLIKNYKQCSMTATCKKIELQIVQAILDMTDIKSVIEGKVNMKNIKYKISAVNITSSKDDYVIKITYDRLGYVSAIIKDQKENQYRILPLIETGPIRGITFRELVGDGQKSILIKGYGFSTGEQTEWLAIYKYRNMKLELIWSGILELENIDETGNIKREKNEISFAKVDNTNIYKIVQQGVVERIDSKHPDLIEKQAVSKEFFWNGAAFKYVEKEKRMIPLKKTNRKGDGSIKSSTGGQE